jgi:hypothetical protein
MYLAPTYAEMQRCADAERTVDALLATSPKFTISTSVQNHLPYVDPAMRYFVSGLRRAGVPERAPVKKP